MMYRVSVRIFNFALMLALVGRSAFGATSSPQTVPDFLRQLGEDIASRGGHEINDTEGLKKFAEQLLRSSRSKTARVRRISPTRQPQAVSIADLVTELREIGTLPLHYPIESVEAFKKFAYNPRGWIRAGILAHDAQEKKRAARQAELKAAQAKRDAEMSSPTVDLLNFTPEGWEDFSGSQEPASLALSKKTSEFPTREEQHAWALARVEGGQQDSVEAEQARQARIIAEEQLKEAAAQRRAEEERLAAEKLVREREEEERKAAKAQAKAEKKAEAERKKEEEKQRKAQEEADAQLRAQQEKEEEEQRKIAEKTAEDERKAQEKAERKARKAAEREEKRRKDEEEKRQREEEAEQKRQEREAAEFRRQEEEQRRQEEERHQRELKREEERLRLEEEKRKDDERRRVQEAEEQRQKEEAERKREEKRQRKEQKKRQREEEEARKRQEETHKKEQKRLRKEEERRAREAEEARKREEEARLKAEEELRKAEEARRKAEAAEQERQQIENERQARAETERQIDAEADEVYALYEAAQVSEARLTSLINDGKRIDARTRLGDTALHLAARALKPDAVKNLLDAGANPTVFNNSRNLPRNETEELVLPSREQSDNAARCRELLEAAERGWNRRSGQSSSSSDFAPALSDRSSSSSSSSPRRSLALPQSERERLVSLTKKRARPESRMPSKIRGREYPKQILPEQSASASFSGVPSDFGTDVSATASFPPPRASMRGRPMAGPSGFGGFDPTAVKLRSTKKE